MTEITNENFSQMFPIIEDSIRHSSFIAIDTEMTGLVYNKSCTPSLFDTTDMRYSKQRQSATHFIICQIGLSLYSKDQKSNTYLSKTYTFYLCPRSLRSRLSSFAIELSAIEFLSYNNFDFEKFTKKGLNYLNVLEEQDLRENFDKHLEIDFIECPLHYEDVSNQLADWISQRSVDNNCGNQLVLKCKPTLNPLVNYAFIQELRKNFTSVWVQQIGQRFVAKPVDSELRSQLLEESLQKERQQIIEEMIGFSNVFQCLVDARRPIVGHNMVMDLLLIYQHFYKPLPKKLKDFKSSLHSLFPYIFDTKCIIFNEKKNLSEVSHILKNGSLGDIYLKLMNDEVINNLFINWPKIEQIKDDNHFVIKEYSPHDSGFDAFATGFVFIKIGHILMLKNNSVSENLQIYSWFEFLKGIEKNCNKVNLIRATTHYMCISESDPKAVRPKWLFARKRDKNSNFSISKLTSTLSDNGTSDIKVIGDNAVIIAVSSYVMSKNILDIFRNDCDIKVTEYDVYKHNPSVRLLLGTALTLSTSLTTVLTLQLIKCFKH